MSVVALLLLTQAGGETHGFPEVKPLKPRASYSLAVVPLGFRDRAPGKKDPSDLFFKRLTGYFAKASGGRFELIGKVLPAVTLDVERSRFRRKYLKAVMGGLPLKGFDGVAFVAAGGLVKRGAPLWPHSDLIEGTDYLLAPEESGGLELGIAAHETMHLLGFDDKYDDEKAEVGEACILGTGYRTKKPAPPCVSCCEKLGWSWPGEVDPRRPVKIAMERDPKRFVKILVNPDGSETLLVELRNRLYVWHAGGGKNLELIGRFPDGKKDRLTPLSDPPFRGRTRGAQDVWITDIRLKDGRARFRVGPSAPLTPDEERRRAAVGKVLDGADR